MGYSSKRLIQSPSFFCALVFCLGLLADGREARAQRNQGYRVTNSSIVVEAAEHWRNWQLPVHAVDVLPEGGVRPHYSRQRYNILDDQDTFTRPLTDFRRKKREHAILNIDSTFTLDVKGNVITDRKDNPLYTYFARPGISRVGSNPQAAKNILDGDPSTYWEPDRNDPLDDWWIEVDLGRVVAVDEILLHFVGEELGDPFLGFRLLIAPDQEAILEDAADVDLVRVGGTQAPNRDQRDFSFALKQPDTSPGSKNWRGRLVQTIRIVVTDTRAGRGAEIDEEQWLALDPSDRGDIVYFVKDQQGFEERLDQSRLQEPVETFYDNLPPERQGAKKFFIRERPRLADIEVWGFGDNISPGIVKGGGSLFLSGENFSPGPGFDGDYNTNFLHLVWSPLIERGVLTVDMGASFFLDAIAVSTSGRRRFIDGYIMRGSDGSRDSSGRLKWQRISPREREDNSVDRYEHLLDTYDGIELRFLEMTVVSVDPGRRGGYNTGADIGEYQIFSQGYPAEVVLTSDLIELPATRNFGRITYDSEVPPGTNLEIRTRSGDLLGKTIRYFDKAGTEITFDAWDGLLGSYKGPIDTSFVPARGWSTWSRAYQQSGDRVTSPGLRKFMQIQVKMETTDRNIAAAINSIDIELVNPVASNIVAELWPPEATVPGRTETFEVFVQSQFIESPASSRSVGFDEILLVMPPSQYLQLLEMGIQDQAVGAERIFSPSGDSTVFADGAGSQLKLLNSNSDSLWVRLPESLNALVEAPRIYNRLTSEGEQVPVTADGLLLTDAAYGLLEVEEQGDVRYFRRTADAQGEIALSEVSEAAYQELEADQQGPIRYFRILLGEGAQFPFDAAGDSLDATAYRRLSTTSRGTVAAAGPLMRLRFAAPVFVNGTTLEMIVRNTSGGANMAAPWQSVEAGDATGLISSNALSINLPLDAKAVDEFRIVPNPFTPNGDGINDETEILFSVFKLTAPRQARVRVYTLAGRQIWEHAQMLQSGRVNMLWDGTDLNGRKVPPGLYICQVNLDTDRESRSATRTRLLSVAY
jgi:hypothetical protein